MAGHSRRRCRRVLRVASVRHQHTRRIDRQRHQLHPLQAGADASPARPHREQPQEVIMSDTNTFLSAEALNVSEDERSALIWVLGQLETGKLTYAEIAVDEDGESP